MDPFEAALLPSIHHLQAFLVTTAAFSGVIAYDTIYCLFDEIKYIYINEARLFFREKKIPNLPNMLILFARILSLPMVSLQLAVLSPSLSDQAKMECFRVLWYLLIFALANAIAIFVIRLIAIRSSQLPMKIFLWSVSIGIVGFFTYSVIAARFQASFFSVLPSVKTAEEEKELFILWRNWTITVSLVAAFDIIVFGLTLATRFHGGKFIKSQSKIGEKFYFDSLQGFAITCSVSIIDLIWIAHNRDTGIFMAIILPVEIFLALSIAPRVLRGLKLQVAKEKAEGKSRSASYHMHATPKSSYIAPAAVPAYTSSENTLVPADAIVFHSTVVVERSPAA